MDPLALLLRLTALARLPRTGWLLAGVPAPESIAAHSHGVALLVLALAEAVEPPLDRGRALALAALHDAPEAVLSDLPRAATRLLPAGAKRAAEERAADELLGGAPALHALWREHHAQESREARFVRLCDGLHLGLMALAYRRAGVRGLDDFRATLAALDASAFAPCEALRRSLLAALDGEGTGWETAPAP